MREIDLKRRKARQRKKENASWRTTGRKERKKEGKIERKTCKQWERKLQT